MWTPARPAPFGPLPCLRAGKFGFCERLNRSRMRFLGFVATRVATGMKKPAKAGLKGFNQASCAWATVSGGSPR